MNGYITFEDIKLFYAWGCYTDVDIRSFVKFGTITQKQYKELTGESFNAD
ncbi:XkdX family protein [Listeria monocytogenes]|nr:XkdX family protein [Listeria monocytogenes]